MDPLTATAARALAAGDALSALNAIALRDDPPALALRGIAMAQLGDLARARLLLRRAASGLGTHEAVARARCIVAEAEIALVSRDLAWPAKPLGSARAALERHGDRANAAHARYLEARYLLLIGRLDEAEHVLSNFDPAPLPAPSKAAHRLVEAGLAMRRLRVAEARTALADAGAIAERIGVPGLSAEVASAARQLDMPAARLTAGGQTRLVPLDDVEALLRSDTLVVDACRRVLCQGGATVSLETRPVLFALARTLAEAWPRSASREALLARAFRARTADESHRARLRVEIGRLRKVLHGLAAVSASADGFALAPAAGRDVAVLAPPTDETHATVLALLGDGEAWSSTALALALGTSQRTVQRALDALLAAGTVQAVGQGPARRWMAPPVPGFPTTLLLPAALPGD